MKVRALLALLPLCLLLAACADSDEALRFALSADSGDIAVGADGCSAAVRCDDLPHSYRIGVEGNFTSAALDADSPWMSAQFTGSTVVLDIETNAGAARSGVLTLVLTGPGGDSAEARIAVRQSAAATPDGGGGDDASDAFPSCPVALDFSPAMWQLCGVTRPFESRVFIKDKGLPGGYHYRDVHATGLGGVLLVADADACVRAYDAACPVECSADVVLELLPMQLLARCPGCGSRFEVFLAGGIPASDCEAGRRGLALKSYTVSAGADGYYYVAH